jgi:gas vesicle protein
MPTILERIRPARDTGRDARHLITDVGDAIAEGTTSAFDAISGAVSDTSTTVAKTADTITERVAEAATMLGDRLSAAGSEVAKTRHEPGETAATTVDQRVGDLRDALAKASREIDATFRDARTRIVDSDKVDELMRRIERAWPGTDHDRYTREFQRGYARGRSGRLTAGMALGAGWGVAAIYFLDPERGASRRRTFARRVRRAMDDGRRMLAEWGFLATDGNQRATGTGVAVGPGRITGDADVPVGAAAGAPETMPVDAGRGPWHRDLEG